MCRWPLVALSTEQDRFRQVLAHRCGWFGHPLRLCRKARCMSGCELLFFPTGSLASPPVLRSQTWIGISRQDEDPAHGSLVARGARFGSNPAFSFRGE